MEARECEPVSHRAREGVCKDHAEGSSFTEVCKAGAAAQLTIHLYVPYSWSALVVHDEVVLMRGQSGDGWPCRRQQARDKSWGGHPGVWGQGLAPACPGGHLGMCGWQSWPGLLELLPTSYTASVEKHRPGDAGKALERGVRVGRSSRRGW